MTTIHRLDPAADDGPARAVAAAVAAAGGGDHVAFTKGAVDSILGVSESVWEGGGPVPLDEGHRARIVEAHEELAARGMRLLGVAFRPLDGPPQGATRSRSSGASSSSACSP